VEPAVDSAPAAGAGGLPRLYRGSLVIEGPPADTFFSDLGWTKGAAFVNSFHLGRYWASQGPQHRLFLPAPRLREGKNSIVVLDLHDGAVANPAVAHFAGGPG